MKNSTISIKLIIMFFLQFAIWGAYLTSMGSYLFGAGLQSKIGLFYAMQGVVSIFMPAIIGIIADRFIPAQRVLSICHLLGGMFMIMAATTAKEATLPGIEIDGTQLMLFYTLSVAFYMPTIALSNSVAYTILETNGKEPDKAFPAIRMFGTIGFICSMLFVNFAVFQDGEFFLTNQENPLKFQYTHMQFYVSAILSLVLGAYALMLPNCPVMRGAKAANFLESTGLRAFKLFKDRQMAIFFIFSMLIGVALQITNGFANPFISSFKESADVAVATSWGASNANALISLSQISETLCILLIPICLGRLGIKKVMLISMFAWVLRFGLFGAGNPGPGVWMFVLSMIVYGVAFDFFNISGSLYVNRRTEDSIQSTAQGLFMLMTNGLGATIGTLSAQAVVNHFVYNAATPDWSTAWYIFAGYALVIAIVFMLIFKDPGTNPEKLSI